MYAPRPPELEFELKLKEHQLRIRENKPKNDFKPPMPVLYVVIILISMLLTIVGFVAIYGGFLRI